MGQATVDAALRPSDEAIRAAVARLDAQLAAPRIESANSHTPDYTSPKWEWPSTAKRCWSCRRSSVMLLYRVRTRPTFTEGVDGPTGGIRILSAHCADEGACLDYQQTQRAKRNRRQGLFILEHPAAPDAQPPYCKWCGTMIELKDPDDYRRQRRNYHRGDEYEVGEQDCISLFLRSRTYEPRQAVWHREVTAHGRLACHACGTVCAEPHAERPHNRFIGSEPEPWQADHVVPLEDGGKHELDNLQPLCIPCHRAKTGRENRERAERRANLREDAPQPTPRPDRRRERAPSPF